MSFKGCCIGIINGRHLSYYDVNIYIGELKDKKR